MHQNTGTSEIAKVTLDPIGIFEICTKIETKCAELYRHFQKIFAHDEELARLWRKTAAEEDNHAEQFRLAIRLKAIGMQQVAVDATKAQALLQNVEAFIDRIMLSRPTASEALKLAIQIEEKVADLHMSTIVVFQSTEMKKLFTAMMQNDTDHVKMLQSAYDKLGPDRK